MTKQDLLKTISQMIHDGEYTTAHDVVAKDGNELLLVTFGKDYMLIVSKEKKEFTFRLKGNLSALGVKMDELISITEEYKAKEAERLEAERLAKLEEDRRKISLWREQRDMLDAKIREVEEAERLAYENAQPAKNEATEQPKQTILQKIFNTRKEE